MPPHSIPTDPQWPPAFSDEFITSARAMLDRRSALLIVGTPGSNRYRLGTEIVDSPDHDGVVIRQVCQLGDATHPLGVLSRVLADLGGDGSTHPDEAVTAIRAIVRASPAPAPTLLLEDATFAAPECLAALATLAVSRDLRIISTMTPETVSTAPGLATVADRLDLQPLDARTVAELLRARFAGPPHDVLVGFLHQRSGGAYASLCELGDAYAVAGAIDVVEGVVVMRPNRFDAGRRQLAQRRPPRAAARLGGTPGIVDLLDLVSLIGEVEWAEAVACTSSEDVALAVRHETLRHQDGVLSMVDPVEAEAIVAALPPSRITALWNAYSDFTQRSIHRPNSVIRTVRWCTESGAVVPSTLAPRAAREVNQHGLYRRTAGFTAPGHTSAQPRQTLHERAHALMQIGDRAGLDDLLSTVDPADVSTSELMHFLMWARQVAGPDELTALEARAVPADGDPSDRQRRLGAIELAQLHALAANESSAHLIRRARTMALSGTLSPVDTAMAYTVVAMFLGHAARPAEAVHASRISVAMLESPEISAGSGLLDEARETLFLSLISAQDLAGAADTLQRYRARPSRYGQAGRLGPSMSGLLEFMRGRVHHGLAEVTMLLDDPTDEGSMRSRGWVESMAAQALIGLERREEAQTMMLAAESHAVAGSRASDLERRVALAFVHDSLAEPDTALEILDAAAAEARGHGLKHVELDALGLSVLIEGPSRARPLLEAAADLVEPSGVPAIWHRFAPLADTFDFRGLIRMAEELFAAGQLAFAARFAQYTLDAGRRATDLTAAERSGLIQIVRQRQD